MRHVILSLLAWLIRLVTPIERLQLHLVSADGLIGQVAQRTFRERPPTPAERLQWVSEMIGRSGLKGPRVTAIVRPADPGWIDLGKVDDDFGPSYLVER